jgi:hypothetical protein
MKEIARGASMGASLNHLKLLDYLIDQAKAKASA